MMERQEKTTFKGFWPWQDLQREAWLREMSREGWHLKSIGYLGLRFTFAAGEKVDYVYQLDFRNESAQKMEEYLELFDAAGWEYVLSWNGWQHFRKRYEDEDKDQIFTDNQSKIQKYKRVLVTYSLFTPTYMIVFFAKMERYPPWFATLLVTVFVVLTLYVGASVLMVALRIRQLEKEG